MHVLYVYICTTLSIGSLVQKHYRMVMLDFFYWFAPWLFAMRCLYRTFFFVLFLFRLHDSRIQGCKAWCYCNQTRYIFNAHRSFKSSVWGNNSFFRLELHPKWAILDAQWVMDFVQVLIIWFHSSHAHTHVNIEVVYVTQQ